MVEKSLSYIETPWRKARGFTIAEAIFSIRGRKFIKPVILRERRTLFLRYRLAKGDYLYIGCLHSHRHNPPNTVYATYYQVKDNDVSFTARAEYHVTDSYIFVNEILRDFFNAVKKFRTCVPLDFNKIYTKKEVEELVKLVLSNYYFNEGEEDG